MTDATTETADPEAAAAPRLAYHLTPGEGPTVMFLPGYASDMTGTKATALEQWAQANGRAYLRFDYAGCGASEGSFEDQTLVGWRDDVLRLIDTVVEGPVLLVGSSMGGWIMLMVALARPDRVCGMVGIAPAPDFTDWGFSHDEKMTMLQTGRLERPSGYSDAPMVTTRAFWASGEANRILIGAIETRVPVRIVHGQMDFAVAWQRSLRLVELLRSSDVQVTLIKDGDHRLSREADIALIERAIEDVSRRCSLPS
ncbi:alpha/beta hydrolase [Sphingomonas sp.]|uniref:alpha/beta fold hydrolase n=1 Tax=Sphingomonas sp. TaxID=28214 RepID=UPI001B27E0AD|nr:alpha/beta hydrolase [Sphingomonas sp.]MBO9713578.1 alpha/beta hydrolase [Sphingomonas sp.]